MHLAAPKPIPPPRTSNPSAGSKTKVAARKRPNQTTWESDGDGDFIGSEEEEGERTNTVEVRLPQLFYFLPSPLLKQRYRRLVGLKVDRTPMRLFMQLYRPRVGRL